MRADLGDLIRATEDFSHVISCDRGHHLAWVNRGVVHLQRGNHRRAVADFDEALALVPNDAMTVSDRGVAHQRLQMHDLALKDFARASQLNPDLVGPRVNAANLLMELGRYPEVISICTEALGKADSAALRRLRSKARALSGQTAAASEDFVQAESDDRRQLTQYFDRPHTDAASLGQGHTKSGKIYPAREGFDPVLSDSLLDAIGENAQPFHERDNLEVPPTVRLRGDVRCIRLGDLAEDVQELFRFAFPGFFADAATPADVAVESALRDQRVETPFNYRRFAGDVTLPRGRYFAVCRADTAAGDQTLAHELIAYAEASETGEVEAVDLSDPAAAGVRASFEPWFADGSVPESAIALRFRSRPGCPSQALGVLLRARSSWSGEIDEVISEFPIFVPTQVVHVQADNVLDLRTVAGQRWLVDALRDGLPTLEYAYGEAGRSPRLFLNGRQPNQFAELLPLLLFQFRGGSPLLDGVASYLRTAGVQGLVYPSARSDPFVRVSAGDPVTWSGWCFVDYRGTPAQPAEPRVVVNPDSWAELTAGLTVRVAPSDSAEAGSFAVDGNVAAIEESRRYKTELYYQRRYSTDAEALQPHFDVDNSGEPLSLVQIRALLKIGRTTLDAPLSDLAGVTTTVGELLAAGLLAPPVPSLEGSYCADRTWFAYRVGKWDAELQIHCMVCDFEQLWPLYMGQNVPRCPRCGFAGDSAETPAEVRNRLLTLFGD